MSEARKATPSCSPRTSGVLRRAATMVSGSSAETTAMENEPRSRGQHGPDRLGQRRARRPSACSIRWASTSVSVAETSVCPAASSSARSSAWFSMIPLWIRARRPVQSMWGWAFSAVGPPWVAQRVWPMAAACPVGASAVSSPSLATESVPPAARARQTVAADASPSPAPSTTMATPAESYPRYSSWCRAPRRIGMASDSPVTPMMPHIVPQATWAPAARSAPGRPRRRRRAGRRPRRPGPPPAPRP